MNDSVFQNNQSGFLFIFFNEIGHHAVCTNMKYALSNFISSRGEVFLTGQSMSLFGYVVQHVFYKLFLLKLSMVYIF